MSDKTEPLRFKWRDYLIEQDNKPELGNFDAYTKAVAFSIYKHMNTKTSTSFVGIRTIALDAGCTPPVVEDRIRRLERNGWLRVERRPYRSNLYAAVIPEGAELREERRQRERMDRATPLDTRATGLDTRATPLDTRATGLHTGSGNRSGQVGTGETVQPHETDCATRLHVTR